MDARIAIGPLRTGFEVQRHLGEFRYISGKRIFAASLYWTDCRAESATHEPGCMRQQMVNRQRCFGRYKAMFRNCFFEALLLVVLRFFVSLLLLCVFWFVRHRDFEVCEFGNVFGNGITQLYQSSSTNIIAATPMTGFVDEAIR